MNKNRLILSLLLLLAVVFACYAPALKNGFTKWDDSQYVLDNPAVQQLDGAHIKQIFSQPYLGGYTPLTFLSFALERSFFGTSAKVFISFNILFHLINTLLVFYFVRRLIKD